MITAIEAYEKAEAFKQEKVRLSKHLSEKYAAEDMVKLIAVAEREIEIAVDKGGLTCTFNLPPEKVNRRRWKALCDHLMALGYVVAVEAPKKPKSEVWDMWDDGYKHVKLTASWGTP